MDEKSIVMALLEEKKVQSKRYFTIIIILIFVNLIAVLSLTGGFLWYINQFDYSSTNTATFETDSSGNITTGDITNG